MIKFNSRFFNPGNPRPLYRKRWIESPYQKSTLDDTTVKSGETIPSTAMKVPKKSLGENGKRRPTQKFYINPFRFASLFEEKTVLRTKLSLMKNFKGPDVIDNQKQSINIEVDLRTVSLRNDTLRQQDNDISRFIKCFHHANSVIIKNLS